MNIILRCNSHNKGEICRGELRHEAYVTTCSHIFCRTCVQRYHFAEVRGNRQCLACDTILSSAGDVVRSNLRPTEDFLTTALAGLDPTVVMSCASKAVNFWNYQLSTEIAWQEHTGQRWSTKYHGLRNNASKVIEEANTEISELQEQVNILTREREEAHVQIKDMAEQYKQKCASQESVQALYNKLKFKVQNEQTKVAVAASTENAAHSTRAPHRSEAYDDAQFDTASLPPLRTSKKTPSNHHRYPVDNNGVEILHPFQRSGSARGPTSSELAAHNTMPLPQRSIRKEQFNRGGTVATPAQRISSNRSDRNYTFPQTSAQRHTVSQHFPNQSIDRNAYPRPKNQSQFNQNSTGLDGTLSGRIATSRNLY